MIKKWWVVALVFTLALSLTSCGTKKKSLYSTGDGSAVECPVNQANALWQFTLETIPMGNGYYALQIVPYQIDDPGVLGEVFIANQSLETRVLVQEVSLNPGTPITIPGLSITDFSIYDRIGIVVYEPGKSVPEILNEDSSIAAPQNTFCLLPQPGQANTGAPH